MIKKYAWTFVCSIVGAALTWFINHKMGYGPFIANGLVGVLAAIFLPAPLAAVTYIASFVGMSSTLVLPSVYGSVVAGVLVAFLYSVSKDVYTGIGGKGGTISTIAVQVTRFVFNLFK